MSLAAAARAPTLALITATCALVALGAPVAARADLYTVHSCKTPSGGVGGAWEVTLGQLGIDQSKNGCPAGALELRMLAGKAHPADDAITATFAAPAGTEIRAYTLWRTAKLAPPYNYWQVETTSAGDRVVDACRGSGCLGLGTGTPLASANRRSASNLSGVRAIKILVTCADGGSATAPCPGDEPGGRAWLHRADIAIDDGSAPAFSQAPSGALVSSVGALSGIQPVSVSASDRGGGVYQLLFEVDGTVISKLPIDTNGGACVPPFTKAMPCKASASATLGFDTASLADGEHQLRLLVTDATATNTAAWGPIRIVTANSTCNPEPPVRGYRLRAGVRGGHGARVHLRARVTTSYRRRVRVAGRLLAPGGEPLPGAQLCLAQRNDASNASLRYVGSTTTDAQGRFSYLAPSGPSRRLYVVYRVPGGAVTGTVLVRTRASVSLHASRRHLRTGQSVMLRGRLRRGPIPAQGVLVELQARRLTGWQTFGTARTTARGSFRLRYRFVRTRGVQRYTLRARVPRQAAYPYTTGGSNRVGLRVVG